MYAPIIIITLNRYEHLVRCIESLKRNPLACETELYISLDFPPADRYREGYSRVKTYLENELMSGFKKIHKYYQKKNLGPSGNWEFVVKQVYEKYDRYIFTEDDNEFSPNFLDYINKGLELFELDEDVYAICGYRNEKPWEFHGGNVIKVCLFHAWGYATWRKKDDKCRKWICRNNFEQLLHNRKACDLLYHVRYKAYYTFIESLLANPTDCNSVYIGKNGEIETIDYTVEIYMIIFSKYCVLPRVSLVRNWGYDGSGVNCGRMDSFESDKMVIDDMPYFEYTFPEVFEENEENRRLNRDEDYKKLARKAKFFRALMCIVGIPAARKVNNAIYISNSYIGRLYKCIRRIRK
mgnify:FL=1